MTRSASSSFQQVNQAHDWLEQMFHKILAMLINKQREIHNKSNYDDILFEPEDDEVLGWFVNPADIVEINNNYYEKDVDSVLVALKALEEDVWKVKSLYVNTIKNTPRGGLFSASMGFGRCYIQLLAECYMDGMFASGSPHTLSTSTLNFLQLYAVRIINLSIVLEREVLDIRNLKEFISQLYASAEGANKITTVLFHYIKLLESDSASERTRVAQAINRLLKAGVINCQNKERVPAFLATLRAFYRMQDKGNGGIAAINSVIMTMIVAGENITAADAEGKTLFDEFEKEYPGRVIDSNIEFYHFQAININLVDSHNHAKFAYWMVRFYQLNEPAEAKQLYLSNLEALIHANVYEGKCQFADDILSAALANPGCDFQLMECILKAKPDMGYLTFEHLKTILSNIHEYNLNILATLKLLVEQCKAVSMEDKMFYGQLLYTVIEKYEDRANENAPHPALELIVTLIQQGASGSYINNLNGFSILHLAVNHPNASEALITTLLSAYPPLSVRDNTGKTALARANNRRVRHAKNIVIALETGNSLYTNRDAFVKLLQAIREGNIVLIDVLMSEGIRLNRRAVDDGMSPLDCAAVEVDNPELVSKLLAYASKKLTSNEAYYIADIIGKAANKRHWSSVLVLLNHIKALGQFFIPSSYTVASLAIEDGQEEVIQILLAINAIEHPLSLCALMVSADHLAQQALTEPANQHVSLSTRFNILSLFIQSPHLIARDCLQIAEISAVALRSKNHLDLASRFDELKDGVAMRNGQINNAHMLANAITLSSKAKGGSKYLINQGIQSYITQQSIDSSTLLQSFNDEGETLLHLAVEYDLPLVVKWILKNEREEINKVLTECQHAKTVSEKLLLLSSIFERGFSVFQEDAQTKLPLYIALYKHKDASNFDGRVNDAVYSNIESLLKHEATINQAIEMADTLLQGLESNEKDIGVAESGEKIKRFFSTVKKLYHTPASSSFSRSKRYNGDARLMNYFIDNPTHLTYSAGLIPQKLDMIVDIASKESWDILTDWLKTYPISEYPEQASVIASWFVRSFGNLAAVAAKQLWKIIEDNSQFMVNQPVLIDWVYNNADSYIAKSYLEGLFSLGISLTMPENVGSILRDNIRAYDQAVAAKHNLLHIALEYIAPYGNNVNLIVEHIDAEAILQRDTHNRTPVMHAVHAIITKLGISESDRAEKLSRLVTVLWETAQGQQAYVRALVDYLDAGEPELAATLLTAQGPIISQETSKVILQLVVQHNLPSLYWWLLTNKEVKHAEPLSSLMARGFYFSLWTNDWNYLHWAISRVANKSIIKCAKDLANGILQLLVQSSCALDRDAREQLIRIKTLFGFDFPKMDDVSVAEAFSALFQDENSYQDAALMLTLTQLNLVPDLAHEINRQQFDKVYAFIKYSENVDKYTDKEGKPLLLLLLKKYHQAEPERQAIIKACILSYAAKTQAEHLTLSIQTVQGVTYPFFVAESALIREMLAAMPDQAERVKVQDFYASVIFKLISDKNYQVAEKLIMGCYAPNYVNPDSQKSTLHLLIQEYQTLVSLENENSGDAFIKTDILILRRCIESFLKYNPVAAISYTNQNGKTPLATLLAPELVTLFLETTPPNPADKIGYEVWKKFLYDRVVKGDYITVKKLLEAGVPPTYIDEENNTLLHKAVEDSQVDVDNIKLLLSYYPDIYAGNSHGFTAEISVSNRAVPADAVLTLLKYTAKTQFVNFNRNGKDGNTLHANGGNALHGAVQANNAPLIKQLLARGVDPTVRNNAERSPIRLAVNLGHWDCVAALIPEVLQSENEINAYGEVLRWVVAAGNVDVAKKLLDLGAATDWHSAEDEETIPLFHFAVTSQNVAMVNLLLLYNVNVRAKDPSGMTSTMLANTIENNSEDWQKVKNTITHKERLGRVGYFATRRELGITVNKLDPEALFEPGNLYQL